MTVFATRPSAFGPIVAASDVELALLAHVQLWLADYLAELDRRYDDDVGTLPYPRGWIISADVEKMPEDQTPTIVVKSPGIIDPPLASGDGLYAARWEIDVAVVLSARGNRLALRLARRYAAALRVLLVQQQLLDPELVLVVRRIDWLGEHYDVLDSIDDRTTCAAHVSLAVEVADVAQRNAGPMSPVLPPGSGTGPTSPTWPTATSVDVEIDKEPQ
jgi:hypothetical protein